MLEPIQITAADGYAFHRYACWHRVAPPRLHPVVIINNATSDLHRYHARFVDTPQTKGCDVLTYDYRGIGELQQALLRALSTGWLDWGENISTACFATSLSITGTIRFMYSAIRSEASWPVWRRPRI